jgi:hypothetical protein
VIGIFGYRCEERFMADAESVSGVTDRDIGAPICLSARVQPGHAFGKIALALTGTDPPLPEGAVALQHRFSLEDLDGAWFAAPIRRW